jgi:hypothetical protein
VISFRYHIVSLVGVLLALAVGIVVGTTALNGPITSDLRNQVTALKKQRTDLTKQVKTLHGKVDTAGQFATTFGARVVADTLKDQSVLIVALPNASSGTLDGVGNQLSAAGAKVTGRLQLTTSYIDPGEADPVLSLATGTSHPMDLTLPKTSDARVIAAAMLAFVLTGKGQAGDLQTVLSGFSGLHMISSDPSAVAAAHNIVVVGNGNLGRNDYAGQAELDLVSQLAASGGQVVVGGDAASAQGNGVIAGVRNGPSRSAVSTVDNADTAFGQVSTALAMAGAIGSQVGQYGTASGAQALFPSPNK